MREKLKKCLDTSENNVLFNKNIVQATFVI
jgi:hypothetical protein